MDNINFYLRACMKVGFTDAVLFDAADFYAGRDQDKFQKHLFCMRVYADTRVVPEKHVDPEIYMQSSPILSPVTQSPVTQSPIAQSPAAKKAPTTALSPAASFPASPMTSPKDLRLLHSDISSPTQELSPKLTLTATSPVASIRTFLSPTASGNDLVIDEEEMNEAVKYDPYLETQAWNWLEELLGESIGKRSIRLTTHLKTGVVLCKLVNKIQPGIIQKIHTKNLNFLHIENIGEFFGAARKLGLGRMNFSATDLIEEKRPSHVLKGIVILANHIGRMEGYTGPIIKEDHQKTLNLNSAFLAGEMGADAVDKNPEVQEMLVWINEKFQEGDSPIQIQSVKDFRNGFKLLVLVQILSSVPYANSVHFPVPSSLVECSQNVLLAFRMLYLHNFKAITCCTPMDIVQGNTNAITALLSYIRGTFDYSYMYQLLLKTHSFEESDFKIEEEDLLEDEGDVWEPTFLIEEEDLPLEITTIESNLEIIIVQNNTSNGANETEKTLEPKSSEPLTTATKSTTDHPVPPFKLPKSRVRETRDADHVQGRSSEPGRVSHPLSSG